MKQLLASLLCLLCQLGYGQLAPTVGFEQSALNVQLPPSEEVTYPLALQQDSVYAFYVRERGVDVTVVLTDPQDNKVIEQDSIDNEWGLESFEFTPPTTGEYIFTIRRTEEQARPQVDSVELRIRQFTATELERRREIAIELAPENRKVVQTLDIDHFWQAFDSLATATSPSDSVRIIQTVYLDRGTDGLKDFIIEREFTAQKFVDEIAAQPKFFRSVRANTYKVKEAVPQLTAIVDTFRALYPDFTPKKICFAIGIVNTGGTVSEDFLLIGTEISTSTIDVDYRNFRREPLKMYSPTPRTCAKRSTTSWPTSTSTPSSGGRPTKPPSAAICSTPP